MGSSQLISLDSEVTLHASALKAKAPVLILKGLDPKVFAEVAGPAFAQAAGFTLESLAVEALDLPPIGDAAAGFLLKIGTAVGAFEAQVVLSARGRIASQLTAVGAVAGSFPGMSFP